MSLDIEQRSPNWVKFLRADEWGRHLIHAMSPEMLNDPETYVHHTAGNPNSGAAPDVAMRQLQDFSHNRGYATVAYDTVCHYGANGIFTIMEGRGAMRSAATRDRNEIGEAICMMGYFQPGHSLSASPHPREVEGLAWGIAWMIEQGWSSLGTLILGHRDNPSHPSATSCPGDYLYEKIPNIREMVKGILAPTAPPPPPTLPPVTYPSGDDMIHPIDKYRNSDTRAFGVPLEPNRDYEFGLDPAKIPVDAVAAALNVAVVATGTPGWLDIRPGGSPFRGTSTVNYEAAGAHNGATIVGVERLKFIVRTSAPAHLIVDVTGYWTP